MSHTQGPLHADLSETNGHGGFSIRDDTSSEVATVYARRIQAPDPPGGNANLPENAEARRTAILFAAAPELVEACEAIVDTDRKRVGITVNPHELYMRAVSLARAALAKAKGE